MTEHMIRTSVGALAVRDVGQGAPVLLWHSLFVDERSWERVAARLGADRRLVVVTGPGHGASPGPGRRYTAQDCADAAARILDELGIEAPVDWVGNAWGGHVGVLFAASRPERCRSLVTLGSPIQALDRRERARTVGLLLAYRLLGPVRFILDGVSEVLLSPSTRAEDPVAVALVEDCLRRADRAALRNAIVSISLRRPDLSAQLPRIPVPTLFVTGTDHHGWTPEQAQAAAALLPQGASAAIDHAAYLVPLEAPDPTVRVIQEFWATEVAGSGAA